MLVHLMSDLITARVQTGHVTPHQDHGQAEVLEVLRVGIAAVYQSVRVILQPGILSLQSFSSPFLTYMDVFFTLKRIEFELKYKLKHTPSNKHKWK